MKYFKMLAPVSLIFLTTLLNSTNAQAWFFFIPGSVTGKISDAITGSEGDSCVGPTVKVNDVKLSPVGNTFKVKSLSGTSSRCKEPTPIRALLEFSFPFATKAKIDIPDGYKPNSLSDAQRYDGGLVAAENSDFKTSIYIWARLRKNESDPSLLVKLMAQNLSKNFVSPISNSEEFHINNMRAWRAELSGITKDAKQTTWTFTALEGDEEIIIINTKTPTEKYEKAKESFNKLVAGVSGIKTSTTTLANPTVSDVPKADIKSTVAPLQSDSKGAPNNSQTPIAPPVAANMPAGNSDVLANKLRELNRLLKEGLINQSDYDAKKQEILKAM